MPTYRGDIDRRATRLETAAGSSTTRDRARSGRRAAPTGCRSCCGRLTGSCAGVDIAARAPAMRDTRIALIVGDLDQLRRVKDELGHAAGDAVLCEASRRVRGRAARLRHGVPGRRRRVRGAAAVDRRGRGERRGAAPRRRTRAADRRDAVTISIGSPCPSRATRSTVRPCSPRPTAPSAWPSAAVATECASPGSALRTAPARESPSEVDQRRRRRTIGSARRASG